MGLNRVMEIKSVYRTVIDVYGRMVGRQVNKWKGKVCQIGVWGQKKEERCK